MTTVRQSTKRRRSFVLTLKYTFICVYWWTRQRIHKTPWLCMIDRYLRRMGDKTIPDSAEPHLKSFYPPFVAGIDLPHQDVVDSYSLFTTGHFRLIHWHWGIRQVATVISIALDRIDPYLITRQVNKTLSLCIFCGVYCIRYQDLQ